MRTLTFDVSKQNIEKQGDFGGLVAGSKGYLRAQFKFSNDWMGYRKVAVFTCKHDEYPVLLNGNTCQVPDEAAACSSFKVHVVGRGAGGDTVMSSRTTVIQRRH